jgi:hypothetical protein
MARANELTVTLDRSRFLDSKVRGAQKFDRSDQDADLEQRRGPSHAIP